MPWIRKPVDKKLVRAARKARAAEEIAHLDYLRAVQRAVMKMNQTQLAEELGVSQSSVSQLLRSAKRQPPVASGYFSADPDEAIKRFVAGVVTRKELVEELRRWNSRVADTRAALDKAYVQRIISERLAKMVGEEARR